jgi:hypothetical protein
MDITKLNVQELKALAYDLLIQAEQAQNDLRIVNQEIQKRANLNPTTQEDGESETN